MSVRAKFKLDLIQTSLGSKRNEETGTYETVEMKGFQFSPVFSSDSNHENKKFWDASPGGNLSLNCVNPNASAYFKIGAEYYLDFTEAK